MTVRKVTAGTGITTHDRIIFEGGDFEEWKKHSARLNEQRRIEGDRIRQVERRAKQTLESAGLPTEPYKFFDIPPEKLPSVQSPEWYAMEILNRLGWMSGCTERGRTSDALSHAIDVGLIWQEAKMKFLWEDDVLTRQSHREIRRKNGNEGADANHRKAKLKHDRWREEDTRIQAARKARGLQPFKRKSDRATQIKKNLDLSETVQTISKRLD
jgi:hypothetical protein